MDKKRLVELIKIAQGNRTQNQFALHCGISAASLSRFFDELRVPSPNILKKIAKRAYNNVTFEELMLAAGYLDELPRAVPSEIDKIFNSLTSQEQEQAKAYMERMVEIRFEAENNDLFKKRK